MAVATLPVLPVLRRPLWDQLDARLRDAAAREADNLALVDAIRRPAMTLQLLARDAPAALVGDALALERMRVILHAASDAAALVPVATSALRQYKDPTGVFQPGLLQHRALAALMAAALRTSDDLTGMRYAVMVVAGLALQCGPAELLARLEPYGAADDSYDHLLRLAVPAIVAAGVASRVYLRGHARDPVERARWRCVLDTATRVAGALGTGSGGAGAGATHVERASAAPRWSAASAAPITSVTRGGSELPAGALLVDGDFSWVKTEWPAHAYAVVGGSPARAGAPAVLAEVLLASPSRLVVRPAEPVEWLGVVTRELVPAVDAARAAVRAALVSVAEQPCTAGEPELGPDQLLPTVGPTWPFADPPPRTVRSQVPRAADAQSPVPGPPAPSPDATAADDDRGPLTVILARVVAVEHGKEEVVDRAAAQEVLTALARRLGRQLVVDELPWVEDALAVVSSSPSSDDDPRVELLLEALARAAARAPDREHAYYLALVPGDAALWVTTGADAAMAVAVASLPGLRRVGTALVQPATAERKASGEAGAVRAGRLTVAARTSLTTAAPARVRPVADRLRLVGTLEGTELTLLEPPRYERRAAGRGAPLDTGVVAVGLDAEDRELARVRLRAHKDSGRIGLAVLVPVTPEVATVELRREQRLLLRLERSAARPQRATLQLATAAGVATARWSPPRTDGPVALTVEVSAQAEGGWVPIGKVATCAAAEPVPLWRLAGAQRVRLVACDGWHAVGSEELAIPDGVRFGPVAIRRIDERRLWAELPAGAAPVWRTELGHLDDGRVLTVHGGGGKVELSTRGAGPELTDAIELERRRALARR